MENSLKGLMLASGIIITCVIISIGFYTAREAKNTASQAADYLAEFNKELSEEGLSRYDGAEVRGSDIINLIRRELGAYGKGESSDVSIKVKTGISEYVYRNGEYLAQLREYGNDRYINPMAAFAGEVLRDENDVITCISFSQR
ncbi:MAG: hypothetical protein J6B85_02425 [Lachnospiraceae bacterium]|nr:hypothetical protein [Lachnospiraceae bacterium]